MTHGDLLDLRGVQVTPGAVEGGMLGSGAVVLWGDVEVTFVPTQFEYQTCWGYAKQAWGLEFGRKCLAWRHYLEPWACKHYEIGGWMRW